VKHSWAFHRTENKTRGQGLVEFALVISMFLLLIFTVIELGRLLWVYSAVFTGAREGARYAAAVGTSPNGMPYFADCAGVRAAVQKIGLLAGIQEDDITIQYDNPDYPSTPPIDCTDPDLMDKVGMEFYQYNRVVVSVAIDYQPMAPMVQLPSSIPISTSIGRTIIRDLEIAGVGEYPTPLPPIPPAAPLSVCPDVEYDIVNSDLEITIDHSDPTAEDIHLKSLSVYWNNPNTLNEVVYELDPIVAASYLLTPPARFTQFSTGDTLSPTDISEVLPTEWTWLDPVPSPNPDPPNDPKFARRIEGGSAANKVYLKFASPPQFTAGSLAVEIVFDNNCISQHTAPSAGYP
jgi:hypothetical protein